MLLLRRRNSGPLMQQVLELEKTTDTDLPRGKHKALRRCQGSLAGDPLGPGVPSTAHAVRAPEATG